MFVIPSRIAGKLKNIEGIEKSTEDDINNDNIAEIAKSTTEDYNYNSESYKAAVKQAPKPITIPQGGYWFWHSRHFHHHRHPPHYLNYHDCCCYDDEEDGDGG